MHSERTGGNGHYPNCSKTHSNYKEKRVVKHWKKLLGDVVECLLSNNRINLAGQGLKLPD